MKRLVLSSFAFAVLPVALWSLGTEPAPLHAAATVVPAADALADALTAVRRDPSNPDVHAEAARAAKAADSKDRALFHARLAIIATRGDKAQKKLVSEMEALATELDPLGLQPDQNFALYLDQLVSLGESAQARKLWANAVDLYLRAEGTPADESAQKGLDKIYSNEDAGPALVRSGLDVPVVGGKSRMSPKQIAAFDKDYLEWEKAAKNKKLDVVGYEIRTNMGYEIGQRIGFAMTQINEYLRILYRHKESGQKLRDCEIRVYKTHAEWRDNEFTPEEIKAGEGTPNVGGFFSPMDNYISTYDQRTVGRSMDDLWETLFHEASHQFLRDVTKTQIPTWVNEGIACFMEGTVLLPNGAVIPNQIAESRLEQLLEMYEQGYDPLTDVITYFQPGSYSGAYYPWGWGLIYFIRNYEDENSNRVYLEHFDEFVKEYKGEAQHDVFARFEEYFIERPAIAGVDNYQAFNQHWRQWIIELGELHFGGAEQADKLIARAQKQMKNEKPEYAVETYVWALRKRPGDPVAMLGMAEACLASKRDDTSMYYFRELLEWTNAQSDPKATVAGIGETVEKLREKCLEEMRALNRNLVDGLVEKNTAFEAKVVEFADRYVAEGLPLSAALLVQRAQALAGRSATMIAYETKLREQHQADARMERDLVVDEELSRWIAFDKTLWKKGTGDSLVSRASRGAAAIISYAEEPNQPRYRLEAKLSIQGDNVFPVFGVLYGERLGTGRQLGYIPLEGLCEFRLKGEEPFIEEKIRDVFMVSGQELAIAIDVDGNQVEYFVDGESVLKKLYPDSQLKGRVGFFAWNTEMTVTDMKLTY
jgi:hypothetical protein